jgi:putative endopeptidase
MRASLLLAPLVLVVGSAGAADPHSPQPPQPAPDLAALDRAVDPCVDFYQFACGGWMKSHPVPADKTRWGRFDVLAEQNLTLLRDLLEDAGRHPERGALDRKLGDAYAACMDEKAVDEKGVTPLADDLRRIAAVRTRPQLVDEVARLHRGGLSVLFALRAMPDFHDARQMIAALDQGGLTLPDRDYYLKDDPRSVETRAHYLAHVEKMLVLAGKKPQPAAADAKAVMRIETLLAKASLDRTARRDPRNLDHPTARADLPRLAPSFELPRYLDDVRTPAFDRLNVATPDFFKQVSAALATGSLADWKIYLAWRRLKEAAPFLATALVDEDFRFSGNYLNGQKELAPRWKRCTHLVDEGMGEALGRLYVDRYFGGDAKEKTVALVKAVEQAMATDIGALDWMGPKTKEAARHKLAAIANNIGYPDRWRDYSSLTIARDDLAGNVERMEAFEVARQWSKIGKPVDRKEWGMSPPTVNAYYRGSFNDINFPAGILQPPFYGAHADPAANFGGIGAVIGHELTHGFDDSGRKFDADGNLVDWWTAEDGKAFEERAACTEKQYAGYVAVKDQQGEVHLNGKLTLGENTADNGGVRLALMALEATLAPDARSRAIDGFTPQQRFFLGWAQTWCQNITDQAARVRALTDPHSPGRYRADGVVSNMPEFQRAFSCKAGQPMVRPAPCRVW